MIAKITAAYHRHYTDNGQRTSYVEWVDAQGKAGRTEGKRSNHMKALFARAKREGVTIGNETW